MYRIDYDRAIELIKCSNSDLHIDAYYDVYRELEEVYKIDCFKAHGFVIFKVYLYDYYNERSFPHIYLHQIEEGCDIDKAISFVRDDSTLEDKYALFVFIKGEAPNVYFDRERTVKLAKMGVEYKDESIRELNESDTELINELVSIPFDSENIEKRVSRDLTDWFERHDLNITRIFGLFEGKTLVGVVSTRYFDEFGIVMHDVIFVKKQFRNHGYGNRLLKSALGVYPDIKYIYQTDVKNESSLSLARSLGFEAIGEMIRIVQL